MEALAKRVSDLESKMGSTQQKKEKVPREKSKYNIFVQDFIAKEKKKGTDKPHKELFSEAAKAWTSSKK
jgi:hypothetical protein